MARHQRGMDNRRGRQRARSSQKLIRGGEEEEVEEDEPEDTSSKKAKVDDSTNGAGQSKKDARAHLGWQRDTKTA